MNFDIVILGLAVTSSWGNGHATTYRSLLKGLSARGHRVLFLERDQPWYAGNRDEPHPIGAVTQLYRSPEELQTKYRDSIADAELVIVGSFVPDGVAVGEWVLSTARGRTAFYDIDTPLTLQKLAQGDCSYLAPELISRFGCYLSFTGGPTLQRIEEQYGAPMARPFYCSVDSEHYRPLVAEPKLDLAYLGTHSDDRQAGLEQLLLEPARLWPAGKFAVAGPGYSVASWPENVDYEIHLSPREHPDFYASQRFTLNLTRAPMKASGYSPSVRLFEAAACGAPIISDWWAGLDDFFKIGRELLVADDTETVLTYLHFIPEGQRRAIGLAARKRIIREHTPLHRAMQLEGYMREMGGARKTRTVVPGLHSAASQPHKGIGR